MKTIKPILILVAIALIGITTARGQERPLTEAQKAQLKEQLEAYFDTLDLSEVQKPTFEDITKRYAKQMMDLKDSDKGRLAKYKAYKAILKNKNEEMNALLSKEQYALYLETQEKMQQKMKERHKNKN
ncbi:hypothetical protein [Winogradskyella sp.]|uniref:hypothetical protein n=1 Tax=Winogradskyella sp. TaxID=1883156 RepID=UPI003BAD5740